MPWFKVDDGLHSHPKPRQAGLAAMGLWTVAGSWSAQHAQEGFVPDWFVASWPSGRKHADALVRAGLWDRLPDGWGFHDWDHFQPSREEIERDREHNRERQRKFREKRRQARLRAVGGNDE